MGEEGYTRTEFVHDRLAFMGEKDVFYRNSRSLENPDGLRDIDQRLQKEAYLIYIEWNSVAWKYYFTKPWQEDSYLHFSQKYKKIPDFEDAVVVEAARKAHLDHIVAWNEKDYRGSEAPVILPHEYLETLPA